MPTEKEHAHMDETEREEQSTQISIPVNWHVPDDIVSRYVNNVFVQQGEYEFIVSLFETRLPLLTGKPEEIKAKLEQLGAINAECVGRFIVAPKLVPKIIDALQTALDKYEATEREQQEGGHTNGS
jgi:predicted transcriptional regulator